MEEGTIGRRLAIAAILDGTNELLPEHGSKLETIQDLAKMDKYRNLHEQFFLIAKSLILHDFSPEKFLDLCNRQKENVGFIGSLDPQRQTEHDGAYSTISYASLGGHQYAIKYFKGIDDEEDIYREIAIQNAVYLMLPQHVPLIRSWTLEYIIMNKVSGARIKDFCSNEANKLSKAQLVSIIDIFTRLAFLGITHGDIQGGNIIIRDDRSVSIIDFGISAFQEQYQVNDDKDLLEVFEKFTRNGELTEEEVANLSLITIDAKTRDTASAKDLLPVLNRMRLVLDHKILATRMDIGADGRVVRTPVVANDRYFRSEATVTSAGISRDYFSLFSSANEIVFLDSSRK